MAPRATRSASRKARVTEAVATGPLGALSHDELGVIFDGLADPLQPVVAVALSSTCRGLRTPLRAALEVLKERHERAVALCRRVGTRYAQLRDADELHWQQFRFRTADDAATLGMLLRTNGLPKLEKLWLMHNGLDDTVMQALCEGLGRGAAPSLHTLVLNGNKFGPAGAEAFAAALRRGAMPKLKWLGVADNQLGSRGVTALASPLRNLPALKTLNLMGCEIGAEGVASLVANLGKDDFKKLEHLWLAQNKVTDAGMTTLAAVLDDGGLPRLRNHEMKSFDWFFVGKNPASAPAIQAAMHALARRSQ